MSDLTIPVRPDNYRNRSGMRLVQSDVFDICTRIKDVSPDLYIYELDPPVARFGAVYPWSVAEICLDGVERFVMFVEELDARVIEKLERMLRIPFDQRLTEFEKEEQKHADEFKANELNELYERVGAPMYKQLEHDGFITLRPKSYAKRGVRPR